MKRDSRNTKKLELLKAALADGQRLVEQHEGMVSIVIPAFNEAPRVRRTIVETSKVMREISCRHEIIFVDDGSADNTLSLARQAASRLPNVRVIGNGTNLGKGSALARGVFAARGDLILFIDADLEVHPRQIGLLYTAMRREKADIVIGSKLHPDALIEYPRRRRILSWGYYLLVRSLFRLPVHDTQTGLKLYRREVLMRVLPRLLVKRYAHDLEVLANAHRLGYKITEAPVVVTRERPFNRIGIGDVVHIALDTLAIWWRMYVLRFYDRIGVSVDMWLVESAAADAEQAPPALASPPRRVRELAS
jgi:glycosyltransferase involved in cell wall biosynthesis